MWGRGSPHLRRSIAPIYFVGVTRKRRARKITAINIMPAITNPGAPNSSPMPVFGKAVDVGTLVSSAFAAWVKAAPTVAVTGSGVSVVRAGISVEVASASTGVSVGAGVGVARLTAT